MIFTREQQRIFRFITHGSGHGIIDAVAGAGKTTTIMECARFVQDKSGILFCAFNTSIAQEISGKFHDLGFNEVTVKTIHSLGRQILLDNNRSKHTLKLEENKYAQLLNSISVQEQIRPFMEKIFRINGFYPGDLHNNKDFAVINLLNRIQFRLQEINQKFRATLTSNELSAFEEMISHFGIFNHTEMMKRDFKEEVEAYFNCHKVLLDTGNTFSHKTMIVDYTDMLYLPYEWQLYPDKQYSFLFIDECQDLSKSQFAIVSKYGKKNGRILAVGDPHQSIYGFTGADIESFHRMKEYTKAKQFSLTSCFRCPASVVALAQSIRADIAGARNEEGKVHSITFDEVVTLAQTGDMIISRLRAPIVLLLFSFIDKNIKVHVHEEEVREIISEVKSIFKPEELQKNLGNSSVAFETLKADVTTRWYRIIQRQAERISDYAERETYINTENKYLQRKLDFLHKKSAQWKDCRTISDIVLRIRDYISADRNSIRLSTIHRAKGLENRRIFIINYDELPYHRQQQKAWEKVQELNLKYVAITRSLQELFLVENKKTREVEKTESLFDNLPFEQNESIKW